MTATAEPTDSLPRTCVRLLGSGAWRARVCVGSVWLHVGCFATQQQAEAGYREAKRLIGAGVEPVEAVLRVRPKKVLRPVTPADLARLRPANLNDLLRGAR